MAERPTPGPRKVTGISIGVAEAPSHIPGSTEKEELISHILELQNTLHDLSQRVNSVKEENSRLKSENQVLNKYIENLMVTSGIFKSTAGKWLQTKGNVSGRWLTDGDTVSGPLSDVKDRLTKYFSSF